MRSKENADLWYLNQNEQPGLEKISGTAVSSGGSGGGGGRISFSLKAGVKECSENSLSI